MDALKHVSNFSRVSAVLASLVVFAGFQSSLGSAQSAWRTIGPDGGDARSFAAVPGQTNHLYLGTANSTLFESQDSGASWKKLVKLDVTDDLVIAHIVLDRADSSHILIAGWRYDKPTGGLYVSRDSGRTWTQTPVFKDKSIFALAQAPSDSKVFVAGTLDGVFRSEDAGATWTLISPPGSTEIHEVESIAIDPVNPEIVYAGTWHLPWKTPDGGKTWTHITSKEGVHDDSDIFSIIVDPVTPNNVYVSACSGIYKSETAAAHFDKVEGIPNTARRTRVLKQDPVHRDTVYAGTTEGLYKTTNAGKTFTRMTGPDVIVNDVYIDPADSNHVMLATDRGGVLTSSNAAVSFAPTNRGFSARKVEALLVDKNDSSHIWAGVVNDKTFGGVFATSDSGAQWTQVANGLDGRDVFTLSQAQDGTLVAGTNSGIFALSKDGQSWASRSSIVNTSVKQTTKIVRKKKVTTDTVVKEPVRPLSSRVYAVDATGDVWIAATGTGIFTSKDMGATWQGGPAAGATEYHAIASNGTTIAASSLTGLVVSTDAGKSWTSSTLPSNITHVHRLVFSADGTLWLAAREGVFFSHDAGQNWMWLEHLPLVDVTGLTYDAQQNAILATSRSSDFIYTIDAGSQKWHWRRTGFPLFLVRPAGGQTLAASLNSGVLTDNGAAQAGNAQAGGLKASRK